jgi:hypothetical protein
MQLERLIPHTDASYERQVFTNAKDASTWLASHGFLIDGLSINRIANK